jgi:hypothetical protein
VKLIELAREHGHEIDDDDIEDVVEPWRQYLTLRTRRRLNPR